MSSPIEIPFDLLVWSEEPITFQPACDSDDPWELLATLVEGLVGAPLLTGTYLKRCFTALEAARERGEGRPLDDDDRERLERALDQLRSLLVCLSISASNLLEDYPELAAALPSLDDLLDEGTGEEAPGAGGRKPREAERPAARDEPRAGQPRAGETRADETLGPSSPLPWPRGVAEDEED